MAESTLSLTHTNLRDEMSRRWRGLAYADLTTTEKDQIDRTVAAGYRRFLFPTFQGRPYRWHFLTPVAELLLSAPYSTGTITVVSGVVTLAGGTFPTWAAQGELVYGGVSYEVSTRDSGTQITLVATGFSVAAGASYELIRPLYELGDDFAAIEGTIAYMPDANEARLPLVNIGENRMRELRQTGDQTGEPRYWCVRPRPKALATDGSRSDLMIWPAADEAYRVRYRYTLHPDALSGASDYHYGGVAHAETIRAAVLSAWEIDLEGLEGGPFTNLFAERLAWSVQHDAQQHAAASLGFLVDPSDVSPRDEFEERFGRTRGATTITLNL